VRALVQRHCVSCHWNASILHVQYMRIRGEGVNNCSRSERSPVTVLDLSMTAHSTPTWESDSYLHMREDYQKVLSNSLVLLWCLPWRMLDGGPVSRERLGLAMVSEAEPRTPMLYILIRINTSLVNSMMHLATRVLANLM
jgi:hypothetical protein